MSRTIAGVLVAPNGALLTGVPITFRALETSLPGVPLTAETTVTTHATTAAYSVTLEPNTYEVRAVIAGSTVVLGTGVLTDGAVLTLPEFLAVGSVPEPFALDLLDRVIALEAGGGPGGGLPTLGAGAADEITTANAAGTALARSGQTVASLLAAARDRATHTGTQLAATISDFAAAVGALLTWGAISGKPSTFTPSAHKTTHATGGGDELTPADIGAAPVSHSHPATDISDSTATGRALMTASTAAAGRTALGLGNAATRDIGTGSGQIRDAADAAYTNARTPTSHTHPLSDLTASGATTGQVPQWSGSEWVPTTPSGGSPGGSGTEVQYRAGASTFGAMAGTTWDNTNRALTITGATVTASQPVMNLSQTWAAPAVTFTGWLFNVTNTASATDSRLVDFQLGGTSAFYVGRDGTAYVQGGAGRGFRGYGTNSGGLIINGSAVLTCENGRFNTLQNFRFGAATCHLNWFDDTFLFRDAAGRLGLRNGTNALAFGVYNTESGALANFERVNVEWSGNVAYIQPSAAGTGTLRPLVVRHPAVALSTLPTAAAAGAGARTVISDSTVPMSGNFGAIAVGGGSNVVPLISDGTNWRIG